MATSIFVPSSQSIFNEFDKMGLLIGLSRLEEETNAEYKKRLLDVFVHRADSTYLGLIFGITRELGLSLSSLGTLETLVDADKQPLLPNPMISFQETKCYIYSDYSNGTLIATLDRFDQDSDYYTMGGLRDYINATGYFLLTLDSNVDTASRSMRIFNQESSVQVFSERIDTSHTQIFLDNAYLMEGTIAINSSNITERVMTENALLKSNQFYVDLVGGSIKTLKAPSIGSTIRYKYQRNNFNPFYSPVIIHNLQSDDFKTKMFEQVVDVTDGSTINGAPTELGSYCINELLSAYPYLFGA